jgi:hypothetical protein
MASEVSISNRALQLLGAARIASLSENTKGARECSTALAPVRDALLRSHVWGFAIFRADLAADTVVPIGVNSSFARAYQYPFPADALRILLTADADSDWIIEGRMILSDWAAPLSIRYIKQITDPNAMDALFQEAWSNRMAFDICEVITGSNTKKESLRESFKDIMAEARRTGGLELLPVEARETDWISRRF